MTSSPRTKTVPTPYAVALAVAALAAGSSADNGSVDLELRGNEKIAGTMRPAFDQESFLCRIPRGATIAAAAKSKIKGLGAPPFELDFTLDFDPAPGHTVTTKGTGRSLAPYAAPASGVYRIGVRGDGSHDGDFDLGVAWKPAKSFAGTGTADAGAPATFVFGAPAGATATIDVKPAKGSAFVAELVSLDRAAGAVTLSDVAAGHATAALPETADYTLSFRNAGAAPGAYTVGVKLKLPKVAKTKLDLRDRALGGPLALEQTVFGRLVGPEGGTLETPLGASPISGSAITLPPDALSGPIVVTISASTDVTTPDGLHGAGPAVEFGPDGTVFDPTGSDTSKHATLTIPYDPAEFPGGTDTMTVYVRTANGEVSAVPKPYVFGTNTVSFTTSHLSTYQAASSGPRSLSGEFLALDCVSELENDFGGRYGFGLHSLSVTGATGVLFNDEADVRWRSPFGDAFAELVTARDQVTFDVTVGEPLDSTVTFTDPGGLEPPTVFRRGIDGDILVCETTPAVLLRRTPAPTTVSQAQGRWSLFHLGVRAHKVEFADPPAIDLEFNGDRGVIDLLPGGTVTFRSLVSRGTRSRLATGTWTETAADPPPELVWGIEEGSLYLEPVDEPEGSRIPFTSVLRGNVLVGRTVEGESQSDTSHSVEFFLLVRTSSGFSTSEVADDYFALQSAIEVVNSTGQGVPQDVKSEFKALLATISADGDVEIGGFRTTADHDGKGLSLWTKVEFGPVNSDRIAVKGDGSFTSTSGNPGQFLPGGLTFVSADFTPARFAIEFGSRR